MLQAGPGVARGPILEVPPHLEDANDSHSLGSPKSLIVGALLTSLNVYLRQLCFIHVSHNYQCIWCVSTSSSTSSPSTNLGSSWCGSALSCT